MKRSIWTLMIVVVLAIQAGVSACPMCKDSIPNSDVTSPGGPPSGINNSVYYFLGALIFSLGLMVFGVVKAVYTTNINARGFTPTMKASN